MFSLAPYSHFYFAGIGGIGMSALARYFSYCGSAVAGYDKTPSPLTNELESEGMSIHFEDNVEKISSLFLNKETTLVVYTPALPKDHSELNYFKANGYTIKKRAEVLAAITYSTPTIAVAGTHGKTSTATLVSHLLQTAGVPFYAFLGGISVNYQTNFIHPKESTKAVVMVVEADEYDRSFLQLHPQISIVTAIEPDHLDIYGTEEELRKAYFQFISQTQTTGKVLLNENAPNPEEDFGNILSYGFKNTSDAYAENVAVENGEYVFDAETTDRKISEIRMGIPGRHNIENAIASIEAVKDWVADSDIIKQALASYRGVHRRFEVILKTDKVVYIDDYAHHPTEIMTTINTVKEMFPERKVTGIFQPHLFTRTRDLSSGFAEALSNLDEAILLPIYPAREEPIEGITSSIILKQITSSNKSIQQKEELLAYLKTAQIEILLTIGAGDIDRLVSPIKSLLESRYEA